ncbi:MAG: hypothetical protein M3068_11150 [Gemmatimonadota bacterium]|nr:hypothetical protein [Gemmatimonadota bacterium]
MAEQRKAEDSTGAGAGSESARGIQEAGSGSGQRSGGASGGASNRSGEEPQSSSAMGSEAIEGRTQEHESGYGGRGGEPRTSSNERESVERPGQKGGGSARAHLGDEEAGDGI